MSALHRVLIANRGEIAIRIAKAASSLGLESVAVYHPVDSRSPHVRAATTAREIAGTPVGAYLDVASLVAAARETGCDCVHPGYGFLAESPAFAEAVIASGLVFVGPSPEALRLFGDKVRSRALAESVGLPVVPGSAALSSPDDAREAAAATGYPVMLKAAAGGGGRGMRVVPDDEAMTESFRRCSSEAQAAFGDATLFAERLVEDPKHIEVQILADVHGGVVHLYERDCSVQLRNQKVVEVAPAPLLDRAIRDRMLSHAVSLARAGGYVNAGTVEFLVSPETGEHFFVECNARIQVEHTVTEQVTGVDLVATQFRIAAGEAVGRQRSEPDGYAVQARVVATGAGTITSYAEPSGPGVRVDACGCEGYEPARDFDPLLAKVIGSGATFEAAVDATALALEDFRITGPPTNIERLRAILAHPRFRAGDARTTLLATAEPARPTGDRRTVESPIDGSVVEVRVRAGDAVARGDPIVVLSAMKMETVVEAPCAGVVSELLDLQPGGSVSAGLVLARIDEQEAGVPRAAHTGDTWDGVLDQVRDLQRLAHARLAPGSDDPGVVRQRSRGKLTCRERIALLLDDGSFREIGSVAGFASYDEDGRVAAFTPANHVGGRGKVRGRDAVVCADDFTSRGGHSDGAIGGKSTYLDRLSLELRVPSIRMLDGSSGGGSVAAMVPAQRAEGESAARESRGAITAGRPRVVGGGGSFLPGHLGSTLFTEQLSTVPVVNMLLGSVVGIGAAKAVLGHFAVMVRDIAQLFVAGPPVVQHAMGYDISKEDLGGWHIHCRNGSVDNLAETEHEAVDMAKRFLSYLPSSVYEPPPVLPPDPSDPADRREDELLTIVPRRRTTTFDIRRAIELMADHGSFFEIGPLWGTDQVAGFVRCGGRPLGVLGSDSRHPNGGAMTADGCSKLKRHLDLCDLFHVPILNLVDNPGFAVGLEHETTGTIRRGAEWMVAFAQVRVPIFTVIMRRSFGVAGNNAATPQSRASMRVAWPAADVGGIPPEGGIEAAYKRQLAEAEDPAALRAELEARIESVRGPIGPLSRFQIDEMIDPRDTRPIVCEWAETAYRLVSQPARLVPRAIGFRP